ncbi:P-loop containing nucleoside triphosphate hydrolase protein [Pavlovales sp. CCMP2436]|nr:P-loop containing nucleoside triphosphate hydrolase protein [Pavlovales sp. CCMP2436]
MGCGSSSPISAVATAAAEPSPPVRSAASPTQPTVATGKPEPQSVVHIGPAKAAAAPAALPTVAQAAPVATATAADSTPMPERAASLPPPPPPVAKQLVLVLGGPGTGLSEQCALLAEQFGCQHLVVGRVMRDAVLSESEEGKRVATLLNDGKNLPAELYAAVYQRALAAIPLEQAAARTPLAAVLLDGYPRTVENYHVFAAALGAPVMAIVLELSDAATRDRAEQAEGELYDEEAFLKRLGGFAKRTAPLVSVLEANGVPVHRIDANGTDAEVHSAVCAAVRWGATLGRA